MSKVLYEELIPQEFTVRLAQCPIAYLPLGTLEYHGEHLPLGADGLQAKGFFINLAQKLGGIVMPMLFLGPEFSTIVDGELLTGVDTWTGECLYNGELKVNVPGKKLREPGKFPGSAYWISDEGFNVIMEATLAQIARAGFKILVTHGHGPSRIIVQKKRDEWSKKYGLAIFTCKGEHDAGFGVMTDHAAFNETSLTLALRPDLVKMERLPKDRNDWPLGVVGRDPRDASASTGAQIIEHETQRMIRILQAALDGL